MEQFATEFGTEATHVPLLQIALALLVTALQKLPPEQVTAEVCCNVASWTAATQLVPGPKHWPSTPSSVAFAAQVAELLHVRLPALAVQEVPAPSQLAKEPVMAATQELPAVHVMAD